MANVTTIILSIALGFLLGMLMQLKTVETDVLEGYEIISCKKLEQRGDTIITINKMVKQWE